MLKVGFARLDITPALGTTLSGYFYTRRADGVLDPLYASAAVFDNGKDRAAVFSVDIIGINQSYMWKLRSLIAERIGIAPEGVFVSCTHTHLAPCVANDACHTEDGEMVAFENPEYTEFLTKRLCDIAELALQDLSSAEMYYTHGRVENVAFIRRYRMKDGSTRTNPPHLSTDVVGPIGKADEESSLLVIKREGKPEIGIVNFQVHPDTIGGNKVSADYIKFVRDTYEKMIPDSCCMYINGAQGDTNNRNIKEPKPDASLRYEKASEMGKKIAISVIEKYGDLQKLSGDKISFGQKNILVFHNKGDEAELSDALLTYKKYIEAAPDTDEDYQELKKHVPMNIPKACRIATLNDTPAEKVLSLTAVSVGDVVFAGYPGEPFTRLGNFVKDNSRFELSFISCCANGYEGYYPTEDAYDGGYEFNTARYVKGTAEKLQEELLELVNSLYN